MPNHVTSRVVITGPADEISRFRETCIVKMNNGSDQFSKVYREWMGFDFNTIIPMPSILMEAEESNLTAMGFELMVWRADRAAPFSDAVSTSCAHYARIREELGMKDARIADVADAYFKARPEVEKQARLKFQAILETGYSSWYPWAIAHWHTKWNAYDFYIHAEDPLKIGFDTAWSFPEPIFRRLEEMFPDLTFSVVCFDEGWNFAGKGLFGRGSDAHPYAKVKATNEMYEEVYGRPYVSDEEEEEEQKEEDKE